jgi:predicted Zn-dependent protease
VARFVFCVLLALVAGSGLVAGCGGQAEVVPERDPGQNYVVPLGDGLDYEARRAAWALTEATGRPTRILPRASLPRIARLEDGRYAAATLLDMLLLQAPDDTFRIAGVTEAHLFAPEYRYVVGYARRGERALLYSTAELPADATEAAHRRRVRRIVRHELGHTYGAGHCHETCVMHSAHEAVDLDVLPDTYCDAHAALAARWRTVGPQDAESLAAAASEAMRMRRWSHATHRFGRAIDARPADPRLRTGLAIALMADGRLDAAKTALDTAEQIAPASPQPLYAKAVLYAAGYAPRRAPAYLEAAVARDGRPARAHRAAGILYQDVLGDPARAVRHFEAHLQAGGRDPGVIARLVYLSAPTNITFQDPETVIARWRPDRGLTIARAVP